MNHAFPASTPEKQGISSSAVQTMLDELERRDLEVTSMMLVVNNSCVLDFCKKPYKPTCRQLWFSTTKAVTGIGVGIACDLGLLSLDDPVISFFPDKLPETISDNLSKLRVRDLLTMTSGIHENTYAQLFPQADWVKAFLAQEFLHTPGTYYRYSTHASHMLAAIVERTSGVSFFDFVKENLMLPLGVEDMTWEYDRQGITCGGMGLGLTTEAVARFGYMLLNRGVYNGRRIVSESYLSMALTEQSDNRTLETKRHKNGYGFHMCIDHDGSFYHEGSFGQLCYVSPKKNAVLAVTSRKSNWDEVIDLFDSLFAAGEGVNDPVRFDDLRNRIESLSYPLPRPAAIPFDAPVINGRAYLFSDNELNLCKAYFKQENPHSLTVIFEYTDRPSSNLMFDFIQPSYGSDYFVKDVQIHLQAYVSFASWQDANTILLTVFYLETPYVVTYLIGFDKNGVTVSYHINVTFGVKTCIAKGKLISD